MGQDLRLDNRCIDLRTPANQAIFRVQSEVCQVRAAPSPNQSSARSLGALQGAAPQSRRLASKGRSGSKAPAAAVRWRCASGRRRPLALSA